MTTTLTGCPELVSLTPNLKVLVSNDRPVSSSNDGLTTDLDAVSGEEDDAWILDECYEAVENSYGRGTTCGGFG
jgi:hypothetical protein